MTEVDEALTHLRVKQAMLRSARILRTSTWIRELREREFLAALSWLADAQERAKPRWRVVNRVGGPEIMTLEIV